MLFGWAYNDSRTLSQYAKALEVTHLELREFTAEIRQRMADMCNKEYVGLNFKPEDFVVAREKNAASATTQSRP